MIRLKAFRRGISNPEQLKAQQVRPGYAPMQRRLIQAVESIEVGYID